MAATVADPLRYPGECDQSFPEVFTVAPPQPKETKPGQLPESVIREFFEKGYVIVKDYFKKEELGACRDAIEVLVDELANKLLKAGKIKDVHKDLGLFQRLTKLEEDFPGTNIILHKWGVLPQAFRDVWASERLLNAVEQIVGPDIAGHPVWNLRTKTPRSEAVTVPWHQDSGYLDNNSYGTMQLTAWIPLLDATRENGCMEVVEGGHSKGKVAKHTGCHGDTWYIMLDEAEMEKTLGVDLKKDVKLCPVPYGGMLLINNIIPHRSLNNTSSEIRWSLDLRWQDPARPVGFYGLKNGALMRSSKNPEHQIDWDSFDKVDRHVKAKEASVQMEEEDEFETTIQGPWMTKWELVHANRHTAKLVGQEATTWHKA